MLKAIALRNFGPLTSLEWSKLGPINLIIGPNGAGKTMLLKALYSAMRTLEEHKRGADQRTAAEILWEKLYWTFQLDKIGDLVTKGAQDSLSCSLNLDNGSFSYGFGRDTTKQIALLKNDMPPRTSNSIFIPAKEVLSWHQIIIRSREREREFGFDDTYYDLAKALAQSTKKGRNYKEFAEARTKLTEEITGGRVIFDDASQNWQFKIGNQKYSIGVTAEGIKKVAILDTLLGNRYLDTNSLVFIDEPEAALHPQAVSKFLDIIFMLAQSGLQFFMASHSYFVIKKLFLISQKYDIAIPVMSAHDGGWTGGDLREGMPDNAIIDESIRLYKEEIELALQ